MQVTFYGAVREVTGSMHLITTEADHILLDCGLFQGRRKESERKNRILPFDERIITNLILSHAHIDHSGRIPMLTTNDFNGRIICTRATADACEYLLPDSAHIQESDADYLNYKTVRSFLSQMSSAPRSKKKKRKQKDELKELLKKSRHEINTETVAALMEKNRLEKVKPLYTVQDAERSLEFIEGYPYVHPIPVGRKATCTLYDAGHILGSAISMIRASENGRSYTVCYTGDLGRFDKPILKNPTLKYDEKDRDVDLMIMESTYGDRLHEPVQDLKSNLKKVLVETFERSGTVLIPSFAYGRTQELLYVIHELYSDKEVHRVPVYVDSPLATKLTRVFGEHPEVYDQDAHKTFLEHGQNPFLFDQMHFVSSVEESMELMRNEKPHIVISASGMCEAGRILHHLRYKIHNSKNTILIVGYMAQHTLGRRILEQGEAYEKSGRTGAPPLLKFLNKEYPLNARVVKIGGFSAHADKSEMLRFLKASDLKIKKIALVHGEEDQSLSLEKQLKEEGFSVFVPKAGESYLIT